MQRKLQNIAHGCAPKAVEGLIFIANHAQVGGRGGQLPNNLFLNIVGILVLVHEHVAKLRDDFLLACGTMQKRVCRFQQGGKASQFLSLRSLQ